MYGVLVMKNEPNAQSNWGGARKGAGRPSNPLRKAFTSDALACLDQSERDALIGVMKRYGGRTGPFDEGRIPAVAMCVLSRGIKVLLEEESRRVNGGD